MDEAFVVVSVISGIFGLIGLLLLDRNWFRRERFKFEQDTLKKQNTLQFKKMARDLGLDSKASPYRNSAPSSPLANIPALLEIAKSLNPDQLGTIADILTGAGGSEEAEDGLGGMEGLIDFATKNPDLVKGFLDGLTKGKNQGGGDSGFLGS